MKNGVEDFAPGLGRSWLEIELRPLDKKQVTTIRVEEFQKKLAHICGMHIFCGPMVIAPDSKNALSPYYTNEKFKPNDWNAYAWWTRPDARNVVSILDHSHESLYYYPDHNLIDISVATCKEYNLDKVIRFVFDFWRPDKLGLRYTFLSPKQKNCSWKSYPETRNQAE